MNYIFCTSFLIPFYIAFEGASDGANYVILFD